MVSEAKKGLLKRTRSFLYRRLCRLVTCEVSLGPETVVAIDSKYDLASFQDVFCHPFYWQLYGQLMRPPGLVVDCGANCGHFAVLADTCIRERFGTSNAKYLLVEPNPHLRKTIERNMARAGLQARAEVLEGLLGTSVPAQLWIDSRNYLSSTSTNAGQGRPRSVAPIDLDKAVGDRAVDIMKIDIEGSEFDFVERNPALIRRTTTILIEIHSADRDRRERLLVRLKEHGHRPVIPSSNTSGGELLLLSQEHRRPQ